MIETRVIEQRVLKSFGVAQIEQDKPIPLSCHNIILFQDFLQGWLLVVLPESGDEEVILARGHIIKV